MTDRSALAAIAVPSAYPHPLYSVDWQRDSYGSRYEVRTPGGTTMSPKPGAEVVSSQIVGTKTHTPMLDLDVPASQIPSSTPGHSHLYIDVPMPWRKYKRLLRAFYKAGLIEKGYYQASVRRRHTALRMPGIPKTR